MHRRASPPLDPRLARSLVVLLAAALAAEARGDELCPGASQTGVYAPPSLPEDEGWDRLDGPDAEDELEEVELAEVFVDDDVLVMDARGRRSVSYHRAVDARGLAPAYRLALDVRTVGPGSLVCIVVAEPPICFEVGFYTGAMIQDRMIMVLGELDTPDALNVVLLVDSAVAPEGFVRLGQVARDAFHTVTVSAVRDGNVHVEAGGEVLGVVGWEDLPHAGDVILDLEEPPEVGPDEVSVLFGVGLARAEWRGVVYEVCLTETENVDVWVETQLPDEPDGRTLKGGTGETLEGLERIAGTVERIDVVHRRSDDPDGEKVVTVLEGPEALTFYDAGDPDGLTRMTALHIPPGELHQLRVVVSQMQIDLRGETHDVRLPSGGDTGLKVVPVGGPVHIPEDEAVALVIAFDPYASLGRNRQGFWWDPVTMTGDVRPPIGPGRCGPLGDPCPPERLPDPAPDPCIGPDCPRGPIDPGPIPPPPWVPRPRDPVSPPLLTPVTCEDGLEVALDWWTRTWLNRHRTGPFFYTTNLFFTAPVHTSHLVDRLDLHAAVVDVRPDGIDFGWVEGPVEGAIQALDVGWKAIPSEPPRRETTPRRFVLGFRSFDEIAGLAPGTGVRVDQARAWCRNEPIRLDELDVPIVRSPQASLGLLLGTHDVVYFRIPPARPSVIPIVRGFERFLPSLPQTVIVEFATPPHVRPDIEIFARRGAVPQLAGVGGGARRHSRLLRHLAGNRPAPP